MYYVNENIKDLHRVKFHEQSSRHFTAYYQFAV